MTGNTGVFSQTISPVAPYSVVCSPATDGRRSNYYYVIVHNHVLAFLYIKYLHTSVHEWMPVLLLSVFVQLAYHMWPKGACWKVSKHWIQYAVDRKNMTFRV